MSINLEDIEMNEDNSEEVYEVECITDKKKVGNKWKYKVKWVGYPDDQSTWEPMENLLNVKEMIEEFEAEFKKKEDLKKSASQTNFTGKKKGIVENKNSKGGNNINIRDSLNNLKKGSKKILEVEEVEEDAPSKKKKKLSEEDVPSSSSVNMSTKQGCLYRKTFPKWGVYENLVSSDKKEYENLEKEQKEADKSYQNLKKDEKGGEKTIQLENKETKIKNNKEKNKSSPPLTQSLPLPQNPSPTGIKNNIKPNLEEPIILGDDDECQIKVQGSFEANDLPKKLITARLMSPNNEVNCLVEWYPRQNGIRPQEAFISNKILREKCPQLLLDFYESRLKFPNNK